jgi:uncharacterized protein YrzB (UPF0473 family)
MEKMMDNEGLFYTLIDDDGIETEFELLKMLEFEGAKYYAMCALTDDYDDETEAEFEVMREDVDAEGEQILVTLEDDALRTKLGDMFAEILNADE